MTTDFLPFEGTIERLYPANGSHIHTANVRILSINGEHLAQNERRTVKTTIQPNDNFRIGDYVFGRVAIDEEGMIQQIVEMTTKAPGPNEPAPPTLEKVYGLITKSKPMPDGRSSMLDVNVISMDEQSTPSTTLSFAVAANFVPKGQFFEALLVFDNEGKVVQVVDFEIIPNKTDHNKSEQSFKPIDGLFVAIKGTIVEAEPYGDGSYVTVVVQSINGKPAGEEWGFPILETGIQVGDYIVADLILDKTDGEVKEVVNFTITPPVPDNAPEQ